MRNLYGRTVNRFRVRSHLGLGDETCGVFSTPSPIDGGDLKIIASAGAGWDHVSVSRKNRCPNWPEMDHIRRLFFNDSETVMQLHIPPTENISFHEFCLHLWRPQDIEIPRPPSWMVGPAKGETIVEVAVRAKEEMCPAAQSFRKDK